MRITVLGKSPSWQDAGGACSGYLIETDETHVLLDCGNGVFGKLRERIDYTDLDGVIISHLHADHFLDLVPYSYALIYAPRQQPVAVHTWDGTDEPARPRLVAPPGATETFRQVVGAWGNDDLIESAFRIEEYERGDTVEIGDIRATFHPVPHFVETFAVRISADGRAISSTARTPVPEKRSSRPPRTRTCCSSRGRCRGRSGPATADTSPPRRPAATPRPLAPSGW